MLPFELTKDTPYLALSGELWSVFYEYFNRNWPCYKGFLLYVDSVITRLCHNRPPKRCLPPDIKQRCSLLNRTENYFLACCFPVVTSPYKWIRVLYIQVVELELIYVGKKSPRLREVIWMVFLWTTWCRGSLTNMISKNAWMIKSTLYKTISRG